ncbi:iron-containing redox enzyme family protein [Nocardia otitidiscaviarum]|uniref:Iron-containing redox enzyme family protein n=1 Tax=Nocardia otitidiscaviarum TaxID=1823 RepID=A0A516NHE9_9NOCA|nr:iron-containing redox enzyme family protein [Nocardia otitidiscaviarum]MCP9625088.1 iron-containing redox enzyme family protein [Nocardia otitidiscaviarum]QDP78333.1 iron-containing redox enzyme family protein [Nocardia otitidiscaviarum]
MTATSAPVTALPAPCGELSAAVVETLRRPPGTPVPTPILTSADPYGRDLHLALHTCYELHYQGLAGVDADWEWDPELLRLRAGLEQVFLAALRADTPGGDDLDGELDRLLEVPAEAGGPSGFLRDQGEMWQLREYFVHRSVLHHQEADPYAWLIPRLRGWSKAALVVVEFDEFGGGRGDRVHAELYADLLAGAQLHPGYLHYLEVAATPMLALVDMMSLFGLHRGLRGAGIGHFAAVEITSPPASQHMVAALTRLDAHPACVRFYREHVEADAVHEQLMRRDVIGDLLLREPGLRESVVFGIQATDLLEQRFADQVLACWRQGRPSLWEPAAAD